MPDQISDQKPEISVREFGRCAQEDLDLTILFGNDFLSKRFLDSPRVQKLGLALSGFAKKIHAGRIQIYGNSEKSFLSRYPDHEIPKLFDRIDAKSISCILVTANIEPVTALFQFASVWGIPIFRTPLPSSEAIKGVARILEIELAPSVVTHGVLMEIFGVGVLIVGESGIGKSECALELIGRGHRLIADDMVKIRRIGDRLFGESPSETRDYLEIRGLGILNARELFGVSALALSAEIGLCLEFVPYSQVEGFDRLSPESGSYDAFETGILKYTLPVSPGRNLATLVEAAVRVFVSGSSEKIGGGDLLTRHDELVRRGETETNLKR